MGEKLERLCLDVAFTSLGVRELFMSCTSSKKRIKICSMEESGRFQGEVIMNGDDHMQRPSSLSTDSNVEHQLCQKQQVVHSPVTIPPSITEEGDNDLTEESDNQHQLVEHTSSDVKDVMVTGLVGNKKGQAASDNINAKSNVDDPPQLVNSHTNNPEIITEEIDNVEGSTPYTYQPQHNEQTHLHELSNAPDGDVELSTVDSSSHSHLSSSKQPHHTTNSVYTYQPQQDKQTHLPEPANAPDDDVKLSTVDSSSRSHVSSSKQSHHTTRFFSGI